MASKNYQPVERYAHSTVKVGDYLYMWGGLPFGDLDNDLDKSLTLSMDLYHLPTGSWEGRPTNGNPPLRASGCSSAAIGNNIYFFGGDRKRVYRNSLHCFNVDSFKWRELSPSSSDHGPMNKGYCGMTSAHFDGEDYLVIIGGQGYSSINTPKQPDAQYSAGGRCKEIHYYRISSDQWISPVVTGDRPPPIYDFTLTPVTNNTAVMFGGSTDNGVSNKLYMINFTKTSVNMLEVPNPEGLVQWPKERSAHSSVLITTSSGPHLLVVGGSDAHDVWLLDINKRKWKELINLPVNVTKRYWHSLSVWSVTPTTNWIIEFGGRLSYADTAVIELRYTSDNDWCTSVIPLDQYQYLLRRRILSDWENLGTGKQLQIFQDHLELHKKEEIYEEQLQREIKEKEQIQQDRDKEQQQLLKEKATLIQQLDDATTLLEQAEKDKSTLELECYKKLKIKDAEILEEKTPVEEKKQIITDYEKLKLKVADMEEKEEHYLKEKQIIIDSNQNLILEKDKVIAKLTSKVEEQLQNEKQIITDLRANVCDNELYTTKLMKEKSQLQERVTSLKEQSIKKTSSIGLQFNYLIPSMDSLDSSVIIAGQKLFILQGDRSHSLQWEKYGFRLECPQGAVSKDTEVAVTALAGGNFKVPKGTVLVSAVYAISVSKGLLKPLVIELQHCVDLRNTSQTGCLKFVRAPLKSPNAYQFTASCDTLYSGMMYYDKKEVGHWKAMYSVVRDLEVLKRHLESKQASSIEYDDVVDSFKFIQPNGTLELTLNTERQVGWTVNPIRSPMKLYQSRVDQFPLTPSYATCSISVYAKPCIAKNPLHCPIELTGIDPSMTIYIDRCPPPSPSSMIDSTSSSSSTASISQTRRETEEGTFRSDIAHRVMTECTSLVKDCGIDIHFLVDKLLEHKIVNAREKRRIVAQESDDEKMDELLHIILSSICLDGEVFGIFLDILREEDTRRTIKLADQLIQKYNNS
uniref:Uncharacterized protein n=2 Tax=Amphimedon queenslandica TaxID=400682 RepID=A0A1X7UYR0_AMPQE